MEMKNEYGESNDSEYATSDHRYPCTKKSCKKRSSSLSSTGVFTPSDISPSKSVDLEGNFEDSFGRKVELFDSDGSIEEEQNKDRFCKEIKNYLEEGIVEDLDFKVFIKKPCQEIRNCGQFNCQKAG